MPEGFCLFPPKISISGNTQIHPKCLTSVLFAYQDHQDYQEHYNVGWNVKQYTTNHKIKTSNLQGH